MSLPRVSDDKLGELRRAMYVMEMNKQVRVSDYAKLRHVEEFEDAVIALGWEIMQRREP